MPVAQWIEQSVSTRSVGGSSPSGRTFGKQTPRIARLRQCFDTYGIPSSSDKAALTAPRPTGLKAMNISTSGVDSSPTRPTVINIGVFRLMLDTFSHDCGVECYGAALSDSVFGYPGWRVCCGGGAKVWGFASDDSFS